MKNVAKAFVCYFFVLGCVPALLASDGFVSIFDGESLDGWSGEAGFWRVEEGAIVGQTTEENPTVANTFLVWEGGDLADFELRGKFKLRNHNSGVQYRSARLPGKQWAVAGYQADIADNLKWLGAAYGERYKGLFATRGEKAVIHSSWKDREVVAFVGDSKEILDGIDVDGWNEFHIIASGNHCIQKINGVITAEFSEASEERLRSGLIALQLHSGKPMQVSFKDLEIRKLEAKTKKKILFLAGKKSHGYGAHEHRAGCLLLARSLNESGLDVLAQVATEGRWPEPWLGYDEPDAVVMYCDGGRKHLAIEHQKKIDSLVEQGVGVACLHYGVEVEKGAVGDRFLDWIGGYFEDEWSVNPHWDPTFETLPVHEITRGVETFTIRDEWYYHMRFRPDMKNVTTILADLPPMRTLQRSGSRGNNPTVESKVAAGDSQEVAWAYERPDGGRGFGFTGGHFHKNWQHDDFRTLVLNAIVWTAKGEVPQGGVVSRTPSDADLELNQDYPKPQ